MSKSKKILLISLTVFLILIIALIILFTCTTVFSPDPSYPSSINGMVEEVKDGKQAVVRVDELSNFLELDGVSENDEVLVKYSNISCGRVYNSKPLEAGDTVSFDFWEIDTSTKDSQGYVTINVTELVKLNES